MTGIYLDKIDIENFKCFSRHGVDFNSPDGATPGSGLNVLIGENGTGKTAVLEAINYTNQSSFASENRLTINDFTDHTKPIVVTAHTNHFTCKMSAPFMGCTFECDGIIFQAKSRDRKSPGKLLSTPYSISNTFRTKRNTYTTKNGKDSGKEIPGLHKIYTNSTIQGTELNVFYFDKNRTRQLTSGTYKTTFERICDDLNWKFVKNLEDEDVDELLKNVAGSYFDNVLKIAQKGTGDKLAKEMKKFFDQNQYEKLRIDLMDLLHPFDGAFFTIREEGELTQISPRSLGSGIEIVLTLLLLRSIAAESKGGIVYLIDEPELHLHPSAQNKLADLLLTESAHCQIIVSTHSPYLIRNFMNPMVNKKILVRDSKGEVKIEDPSAKTGRLFPWSPSWGEVNYNAYGMATVEFHNELYGWLQEKNSLYSEADVESYLVSKGVPKKKQWAKAKGGKPQNPYSITLCSYVRNSIHHPENNHNPKCTESELQESIDQLINAI